MSEEQLNLDLGDEVQQLVFKARQAYSTHYGTGQTHYIVEKKRKSGQRVFKYAVRTFIYDVDWDYLFEFTSVDAAMEIVYLQLAWFHSSVDKELVDQYNNDYKRRRNGLPAVGSNPSDVQMGDI